MAFGNKKQITMSYKYTNTWFQDAKPVWSQLIPQIKPKKILEIGSFEGASACYLIETLSKDSSIELVCIDTWEGGIEHEGIAMNEVEQRFHDNLELAKSKGTHEVKIRTMKARSDQALCELIASGHAGTFDLVYIDGSHQAPDVLVDSVLAFKLAKVGGFLFFDDYLGFEKLPQGKDLNRSPKMAIDSFVNCYIRKLDIISAPLYQLYMRKTSD